MSERIVVLTVTAPTGMDCSEELKEQLAKRLNFTRVKNRVTSENCGDESDLVVSREEAIESVQDGSSVHSSYDGEDYVFSTLSDLQEAINTDGNRKAVIFTDANGVNQVQTVIGRFDTIELYSVFVTDKTRELLKNVPEELHEQVREEAMSSSKSSFNLTMRKADYPQVYMMCDKIKEELNL